jgi:prepilin-type N-terminal cleavage/methylation domain-containing protein
MQQIASRVPDRTREAFSLIELLLVIFIISLVYFLGFNALERPKHTQMPLTPETLKAEISHSDLFNGSGTLLCVNNCDSCYLQSDLSSGFKRYKGKSALQDTQVYTLDRDHNLQKVEYGRFHDQKICLLMHFYPNGSSTKLILKTPKGIYLLPSFFGDVKKFSTLDEARDAWIAGYDILSREGDFY